MTAEVPNADALYKPFPPFSEWARSTVDTTRWERYAALLERRGELSPELLRKARDVVKRAAAVDTGAIEGLYEVDRGFTFTIATQAAMWEAALDSKGQKTRALIESQMAAYDYVLDAATQNTPISEAWLRTLHTELCKVQDTYSVMTEVGPQNQPLPLGRYKHLPNHVRTADGQIHSYAPVDLTPAEVHRLMTELRKPEFIEAHAVLQASYAHYALVAIHPFADGNGRVARALASVFTYRSHSIPLLILVEHRQEYYEALAAGDEGDFQPFVDFALERCLDAILLVDESLRAAMATQPVTALAALKNLYVTKGGYSHEEVDNAGQRFLQLFTEELSRQSEQLLQTDRLTVQIESINRDYPVVSPAHRHPVLGGTPELRIRLTTAQPAYAKSMLRIGIEVPQDAGREDDILLRDIDTSELAFAARASELIPRATAALQIRVAIAVQRILGSLVEKVVQSASDALRSQGY